MKLLQMCCRAARYVYECTANICSVLTANRTALNVGMIYMSAVWLGAAAAAAGTAEHRSSTAELKCVLVELFHSVLQLAVLRVKAVSYPAKQHLEQHSSSTSSTSSSSVSNIISVSCSSSCHRNSTTAVKQ
jgi:hypothetical protein